MLFCFCLIVIVGISLCVVWGAPATAAEWRVSPRGDDGNDGSAARPLKTISMAAEQAQPGDVVTVHEGVYRERITPPRGGTSGQNRIVYQSAPGEHAVIKGSEVATGWEKVAHDTWKVVLPNSFFGDYNPYADPIRGDWFDGKDRVHHTGAVYFDGHWLAEAAELDEVLAPVGAIPGWYRAATPENLAQVAWIEFVDGENQARRIDADAVASANGVEKVDAPNGSSYIGKARMGDWALFEDIDLGAGVCKMRMRVSSPTGLGILEARLDRPHGQLLVSQRVPDTGGWEEWETVDVDIPPLGGVQTICLAFKSADPRWSGVNAWFWFAQVDDADTTIWAQFDGVDPNEHLVEVNAREAVFYPEKPFVDYITVRGFELMHAATQWAPPTTEQVGLIGTHWSKGWIIEDNHISYSACTGITLGKYGDHHDNTPQDTAEKYVDTIQRALDNGWNRETVGGHVVRNNLISNCEQAGLAGSMGGAFSTIADNTIHDIHVRCFFTGYEMAGIKLHGAVDTAIERNHIYKTTMGIWLDWMAQGTRVSRNLIHDSQDQDIMTEVNHGPFIIDNNVLLSKRSILSVSRGGAYVHNLFGGDFFMWADERVTPYLKPHSTQLAGMSDNPLGDDRFFNNIFLDAEGLQSYDDAKLACFFEDNLFPAGANPPKAVSNALTMPASQPGLTLVEQNGTVFLKMHKGFPAAPDWAGQLVATARLGLTKVSELPYVNVDDSPITFDIDYLGRLRDPESLTPGPFARLPEDPASLKVWPQGDQD